MSKGRATDDFGFITLLVVACLLYPMTKKKKGKKMHEQIGADAQMDAIENKSRIRFWKGVIIICGLVATFLSFTAWYNSAQGSHVDAATVEVVRGYGLNTLHETEENGVTVVRSYSGYLTAPIMEPVEPEVNSARQFWNEYDAWRVRDIRRKLYPRP